MAHDLSALWETSFFFWGGRGGRGAHMSAILRYLMFTTTAKEQAKVNGVVLLHDNLISTYFVARMALFLFG